MENGMETFYRNRWEFGIAYWMGSLCLAMVVKYVFTVLTPRVIDIVDGSYSYSSSLLTSLCQILAVRFSVRLCCVCGYLVGIDIEIELFFLYSERRVERFICSDRVFFPVSKYAYRVWIPDSEVRSALLPLTWLLTWHQVTVYHCLN